MALRALLMRKKIEEKKKELEELRGMDADLQTREEELETAINEAESAEDREAVTGLVDEFDAQKKDHEARKEKLSGEVETLEKELEKEEKEAPKLEARQEERAIEPAERKTDYRMGTRKKFFGMDARSREQFFARAEIKDFLSAVRAAGYQKRSVTGADLTIPDVMLELIRENISKYSKLISRVNLKAVPGKARQNIMGTVPEAVWTEMCATLNELDLSFSQVEVDGYKVGGLISICNAILEDSDLSLASEIMDVLGQSIGYALDKAILYGPGPKTPKGIVPRLAQTAAPTGWGANAPAWKDLHTSNIQTITGKTGTALFQAIITASGAAEDKYSRGGLTWIMKTTTKTKLMAEALSVNAAGAIVTGINDTMPVIGGDIVTLDFIPANDVIFGYFDNYLLAQRAGATLAQSEHVRFVEDQTVFRGTARYDGTPVIGEAFGVINIAGTAPGTSATFATDSANTTTTG